MKRDFLILLVLFVLAVGTSAWGQCPGVPPYDNDNGICDTLYVEPWPADTILQGTGPYYYLVRVPIYYTHDVPVDSIDSIAGMAIPLCYTHTNPAKYCSLSTYWNTLNLAGTAFARSIFRTMDSDTSFMKRLYEDPDGPYDWANKILTLDGTSHFWLALIPASQPLLGSGSRVLLATMTFKPEDTMHVCIDTCFWPPSSRFEMSINWLSHVGATFKPRMGGTPPGGAHPDSSYERCFKIPPTPSDVKEIQGSDESKPSQFSLSQNYPNPFNPITNFQFTLPKPAHVKIDVFNIVGQKVKTLMDQDMKPGVYQVDWDGKDESGNSVSTGVYFYKVQAGDFSDMKKMVLLK